MLEKCCSRGDCKKCKNVCKKISKLTDMSLYFTLLHILKNLKKTSTKQGQTYGMQEGNKLIYNNNTTQELREILKNTLLLQNLSISLGKR